MEKKNNNIPKEKKQMQTTFPFWKDVIIALLTILILLGSYFLFRDNNTFNKIYEKFGIINFIIVIILIGLLAVSFFIKETKETNFILLIVIFIIGIETIFFAAIFEQYRNSLFNDNAISFIETGVVKSNEQLIISEKTESIVNQEINPTSTEIPLEVTIEVTKQINNEITEFVDEVNKTIIYGLSNTNSNWSSVDKLFCSQNAKNSIDTFRDSMTRKYGSYTRAPIYLTAMYSVSEIIKTPVINENYMWEFAQIEKWDYLVYQGQPSERVDSVVILVNYTINKVTDNHFCVYSYSTTDPDNKYLFLQSD